MAKRKRKKKTSRLRRQRRIVLLLLVIVFILAGVIAVSESIIRAPQVPQESPAQQPSNLTETDSLRKAGVYNVLVCGVDDGNGGSDTIMLASMHTEEQKVTVVSIPRDTLVNEDWTVKKINSAYNRGGVDRVEEQVEKLLGIPVDFYVTVDLNAFVELVDAIGGVDFDVPIDMNYDDPLQDLHIHFTAGMQHLDGKSAMGVVRFRHNNNGGGYPMQDLDRIKTQQAFLKTVAEQLFSLESVVKVPEFARIFSSNVNSNLEVGEMIWFGNQILSIGTENITFTTLPGQAKTVYGGSYYVVDKDECLTLVNESLNPYKTDISASDMDIKVVN